MFGFFDGKTLPRSIAVALDLQQQALRQGVDIPLELLHISHFAANTLFCRHLPFSVVEAALLTPLLDNPSGCPIHLKRLSSEEAILLAGELITWRSSKGPLLETGDETLMQKWYSTRLQWLFRRAYLDLPGVNFILLLMADFDARFSLEEKDRSGLAREAESVYIPLAGMLGMWSIRRRWVENAVAILSPEQYRRMESLVGGVQSQIKLMSVSLLEGKRTTLHTDRAGSNQEHHGFANRNWAHDKAEAFGCLKSSLVELFRKEKFRSCPRVVFLPSFPGQMVRHLRDGASEEELATRLTIGIVCNSVLDCYRALGVVHTLGKPVAPRFSERFDDFIASPQPNGYRALQTAIIYRISRKLGKDQSDSGTGVLVQFRILTPEMSRVNAWGIVAAKYHRSRPDVQETWWNQSERLSRQLHDYTSKHQKDTGQLPGHRVKHENSVFELQDFLRRFEPGSRSHPLYLFSPRAEIFLVDEGSTPLDFAYRVHTDLGHSAAGIIVNGQEVPHNYPLQNGDIVWVKKGQHSQGPDHSWLGSVTTAYAKGKIRQSLNTRARAIHKGRAAIEDLLLKTIDFYEREKRYPLTITNARLDAFLNGMVFANHMANLDDLYNAVRLEHERRNGRFSPSEVVQRLVSAELAVALEDEYGQHLPYPIHKISLCDFCRPVPGEPVVAFERRKANGKNGRLVVHHRDNEKCQGLKIPGPELRIRWSERPHDSSRERLEFQLLCEDRDMLLSDVLLAVHWEVGAQLSKVNAKAHKDGTADVQLLVDGENWEHLARVQAKLQTVRSVHQVLSFPPSPSEELAYGAKSHELLQVNPYSLQEVYDRWMFYDREEPIRKILAWLEEPKPTRWLVLHGQKRVGKSSLIMHLKHTILPSRGLAIPILVDLHDLGGFDTESIANLIVGAVCQELRKGVPQREPAENAASWLNRSLEEASKQQEPNRLLLAIDEFNALLEWEADGQLDPLLFPNLLGVMSARRDLNWLIVAQDSHYANTERWGGATRLFQNASSLPISMLDAHWAESLVVEPARRMGITYNKSIPRQIVALTNGHPWLIQIVCHNLIQKLRNHNRVNVTDEDLKLAVQEFCHDGGRWFNQYMENVIGLGKILLSAIGSITEETTWVRLSDVIANLEDKAKLIRLAAVHRSVDELQRQGILAVRTRTNVDDQEIRIQTPLFHQWVSRYVDLKDAIEEWNSSWDSNSDQQ